MGISAGEMISALMTFSKFPIPFPRFKLCSWLNHSGSPHPLFNWHNKLFVLDKTFVVLAGRSLLHYSIGGHLCCLDSL
jgi:hypothetical protein